ncbi:MAG: tRNA (N(6)-L-threonylcarbamoyladenosine(37)-C(2))-methylthiotransferase MtaB [Bacteroidia bacterium]
MKINRRVAFYTLGCKLNFSETSTIARSFSEAKYERVEFEDHPDVFVINTCSVTENADKKCRSLVNRAMRISPHAYVVIIGCYAQLKPGEISEIPGVDLVLGANEKFNVVQFIEDKTKSLKAEIHACEIEDVKHFIPSYSSGDRTRVFFKIQDGCDYSCSFCTIPLARGGSRSATIEETLNEAKALISGEDIREIVLTGVNTGDFGRYNGESFEELIKRLDAEILVDRIRISSIEPNLLTDEIIKYVSESKRFVPHFHIPLQSGSDLTLRRMRRRYQRELYKSRIKTIKTLMPDCCIGVDVIVGFPGETDEEFLDSFNFINDLDVSYLHVFTYSERANTHAIELSEVVPSALRAKRSKQLHSLSEKKKRAFYQSQIGKTAKVLWEAEQNGEFMYGFTDNYVKIKRAYQADKVNMVCEVAITAIDSDGICSCSDVTINEPIISNQDLCIQQ